MKMKSPQGPGLRPVSWLAVAVGTVLGLVAGLQAGTSTRRSVARDERGLSQSTENAILLAGAVVVATLVITVITAYVKAKLPK